MEPLIRNISDTARWVAVFRADESERPDAVFHDPFARRLAGSKGEAIANNIGFSKQNSWSFVARTFLFDECINHHVEQGYDTVINLAAGLDARPYRMQLPLSLEWIEIDLPGILDYKEEILANEKPNCALQRIRQDLSDSEARKKLFKDLGNRGKNALIISEGLIAYLDDTAVGALAQDLAAQKSFKRWALDLMSPALHAVLKKEMSALEEANMPLKFAPEEGEDFFAPYGWRSMQSKSFLKTAASLKRLPEEIMPYAAMPEPEGHKRPFPWAGVCLFENAL